MRCGMKSLFARTSRICMLVLLAGALSGSMIVNSLMFHPEAARGGYSEKTPGYVDIGTNGVRIAALVLDPKSRNSPPSQEPKRGRKVLIRCHGNAENIKRTLWALGDLTELGYTVAAVDYPGYGLSAGKPDEAGCYRNVHRLYEWLIEKRGFKPEEIFVDGFSIGSGPATELAATKPVGGLILEAPFLSAVRVVTSAMTLPDEPFPNFKRIADVKCPVLIMHGTKDKVIPHAHGRELFERANEPKRFVSVKGGDHNSLPARFGKSKYRELIVDFMENGIKEDEGVKR